MPYAVATVNAAGPAADELDMPDDLYYTRALIETVGVGSLSEPFESPPLES